LAKLSRSSLFTIGNIENAADSRVGNFKFNIHLSADAGSG
jgi:hypothetical protein